MNDKEIYSKTEAGREEMRTRALQLPGALRNVLLLVDGNRTVAQLKELTSGGKASPDALEQLNKMGLIGLAANSPPGLAEAPPPEPALSAAPPVQLTSVAPHMQLLDPIESLDASEPPAPLVDGGFASPERFNRLYTLMNELVSDYLGLRGYFMQLKIEKCANAEELLALQGELGTSLAKIHGKEVAAELMARISAAAR